MEPRRLSPWLCVAAMICFLMPFFTISCANTPFVRISGVQLMWGKGGSPAYDGGMLREPSDSKDPEALSKIGTSEERLIGPMSMGILDFALIGFAAWCGFSDGRRDRPAAGKSIAWALACHAALWIFMCFCWLQWQRPPPPTGKADLGTPEGGRNFVAGIAQTVSVSPAMGWYIAGLCLIAGLGVLYVPGRLWRKKTVGDEVKN